MPIVTFGAEPVNHVALSDLTRRRRRAAQTSPAA
jgi:hypothetical protein